MGEPFDQEHLQYTDCKQELHKEERLLDVEYHHIEEDLRMVEAKLHEVVAKHQMEVGLHSVVELPYIQQGVPVKMVEPFTQVGTMEEI